MSLARRLRRSDDHVRAVKLSWLPLTFDANRSNNSLACYQASQSSRLRANSKSRITNRTTMQTEQMRIGRYRRMWPQIVLILRLFSSAVVVVHRLINRNWKLLSSAIIVEFFFIADSSSRRLFSSNLCTHPKSKLSSVRLSPNKRVHCRASFHRHMLKRTIFKTIACRTEC